MLEYNFGFRIDSANKIAGVNRRLAAYAALEYKVDLRTI